MGIDLDAIRAHIPDGYDGPWYVERAPSGDLLVGFPTDNPLAGLVATVPDYGADLAEFIAHARQDIPALLAEVDRLTAKLAEYEGDDRHQIEFRDDGWTIMHPIACRPNLSGCPVNRVASGDLDGPPASGFGRYYCYLDAAGLVVAERVGAS